MVSTITGIIARIMVPFISQITICLNIKEKEYIIVCVNKCLLLNWNSYLNIFNCQ